MERKSSRGSRWVIVGECGSWQHVQAAGELGMFDAAWVYGGDRVNESHQR
jgi:hypothetical protein